MRVINIKHFDTGWFFTENVEPLYWRGAIIGNGCADPDAEPSIQGFQKKSTCTRTVKHIFRGQQFQIVELLEYSDMALCNHCQCPIPVGQEFCECGGAVGKKKKTKHNAVAVALASTLGFRLPKTGRT